MRFNIIGNLKLHRFICVFLVCVNNVYSSGVESYLGNLDDFSSRNQVFIPQKNVWSDIRTDNSYSYRSLEPLKTAEILFNSFGTDSNGFCLTDMVLEIIYRDDITVKSAAPGVVLGRAIIESRIDFTREGEFFEIGHLTAKGDSQWKVAQILIPKTPRQMLRAIDGAFRFRIVMPKSNSIPLPVAGFRLKQIDREDLESIREKQRAERGLRRDEFKDSKNGYAADLVLENNSLKNRLYKANNLELMFPGKTHEIKNENILIVCNEIAGLEEAISFVYEATEACELKINLNELKGGTGVIPISCIKLQRVVVSDKRWGWGTAITYGKCPDYLVPVTSLVKLSKGQRIQIWVNIKVPSNSSSGAYCGDIKLIANEREENTVKVELNVLKLKRTVSSMQHFIYDSPFDRPYHFNPTAVLEDMKNHGLVPILYPDGRMSQGSGYKETDINELREGIVQLRRVYPHQNKILLVMSIHANLWQKTVKSYPPFQYRSSEFERHYREILTSYSQVFNEYGFTPYYSFEDEPFAYTNKRAAAYYCSDLAKSLGLKTWSTHSVEKDKTLFPANSFLKPLISKLDLFVEHVGRLDSSSIEYIKRDSQLGFYTSYLATSVWPVYNRFLHGFYASKVEAEGVICYAYRNEYGDPYDDMDTWAIYESELGRNDSLLTYPSWSGEIYPTLSYEALREGIEDSILISTLKAEIKELKKVNDGKISTVVLEAEDYLANLFSHIETDFKKNYWKHPPGPVDPIEKKILNDLSAGKSEDYEVFDKIRWDICRYITKLQNILEDSK